MTILPCSHCNSRETYINAQARGPAQYHFDNLGNLIEVAYDNLRFEPSLTTVRCAACCKIRRDLRLVEGKLMIVENG